MEKNKHKNKELLKKLYVDFVKNYKFDIFSAFFLLVIVSVTASAYPYLIQLVFDNLIENNSSWMVAPIFIAILAIIRGISMYLQIKQVAKIALKIGIDIQKKLTSHILFSDVTLVTKISSGNHISRIMNDVRLIRDGIEKSINNLIRDSLTIFFLIGYLIWLDWLLSLLVILIYPLALKPIINIGKRQRLFAKLLQEHLESLTSSLSEVFRSIKMIKSYSLEKEEKNRINDLLNIFFEKLFNLIKGRAKVIPILEVLGGLAAALVIFIASYRVIYGNMTPGSVIGFVTALLMLAQPARALGTFNAIAQEGLSALERIFSQLDVKPKVEGEISNKTLKLNLNSGPEIQFNKVSFYYNQNEKILNSVSFKINKSEKIGIIGPSGSGKSTILNLLSRFFDPSFGNITINGQDMRNFDLSSLRKMVSLVSQDIIIYNDTFYKNILLGNLLASKEDVIKASKKANIHNFIMGLPKGYDSLIGESGNTLSGGQKQRLSIARAFVKKSKILLLDEVTSSLDKMTSRTIKKSISELSKNKTCVTITHNLEDIKSFEKVILLKNGRVVIEGKHEELIKNSKSYSNYINN